MAKKNFLRLFMEFLEAVHSNAPFRSAGVYQSLYQSPLSKRVIYTGLKNLEVRGLLNLKGEHYSFTEKGKTWLSNSHFKYFQHRYGKWDKKWRIILFDIPVEMEKERQIFRKRLKRIGCHMIQKSVFVFPYPCEEEIGDWCEELGLSDRVDIITADSVGSKESEIKKYFSL